jgi:lipoic acid synthetase
MNSLKKVCDASPDIFNHNIETVPGLYESIRPKARYFRSLRVLEYAANAGMEVKSGLMLGLGEISDEIREVFKDLVYSGCKYLTLGQYLSPSEHHAPVARYLKPEEFDRLAQLARLEGFKEVFSGPFVRSSYRAEEFYNCKDKENFNNFINAQAMAYT